MTHFSRSAWGARAARRGPGPLLASRVEGLAFHWPAMSHPLKSVSDVKAALRGWQDFHMDDKRWSDIAYQRAIDQAGNVYDLRGLRTQSGANGDEDVNQRFGAVLLILAPGETPSAAMLKAIRGTVTEFRKLFPKAKHLVTHNDIRPEPTACPGPIASTMLHTGKFEPNVVRRVVPRKKAFTRGPVVDSALKLLQAAKPSKGNAPHVNAAIVALSKIHPFEK